MMKMQSSLFLVCLLELIFNQIKKLKPPSGGFLLLGIYFICEVKILQNVDIINSREVGL